MTDSGAAAPLLHLAAALGTRDLPLIRSRMEEASAAGHADAVGEVVLMAFFVTGFPAGLQAARTWAEVRPTPPTGEAGSERMPGAGAEKLRRRLRVPVREPASRPRNPASRPPRAGGGGGIRPDDGPTRALAATPRALYGEHVDPMGCRNSLVLTPPGALLVGADPVGVEEAIEAGLAAVTGGRAALTGGGAALSGGGAAVSGGGAALSESGEATALAEGVRQLWNTVRERVSSQTAGPEET